jgi:hypothetical protein
MFASLQRCDVQIQKTSLRLSVILGFLKNFPSELVGGWSSGTGAAGVGGSGLYLGFRKKKQVLPPASLTTDMIFSTSF